MIREAWTIVNPDGTRSDVVVHAGDDGLVQISLDALRQLLSAAGYAPVEETVHRAPSALEAGLTPCCGRTPFELPATDRITNQPELVTCSGAN